MANKKISDYTSITQIQDTDLFEISVDIGGGLFETHNVPGSVLKNMIGSSNGYGYAYRTTTKTLAATNTWYDIEMDSHVGLSNITHSTTTNTERIYVDQSGVYSVSYFFTPKRQGSGHHCVGRLFKNGTAEVPGSFNEGAIVTGDANENINVGISDVMVSLNAGDYLTVQVGTNVLVTPYLDQYDDQTLPDPTTRVYAGISITKLDTVTVDNGVSKMIVAQLYDGII